MKILKPEENEKIMIGASGNNRQSLVIQFSNDDKRDLLLDKKAIAIEVMADPKAENTRTGHCDYLRDTIADQVGKKLKRPVRLSPGQEYQLPIFLGSLSRLNAFKHQNHLFNIVVIVNRILTRHFLLSWAFNAVEKKSESANLKPIHLKTTGAPAMENATTRLLYQDTRPFIVNLTATGVLKLTLVSNVNLVKWVDVNSTPPVLKAQASIELEAINDSDYDQGIFAAAAGAFAIEPGTIIVTTTEPTGLVILHFNYVNVNLAIARDLRCHLKIVLMNFDKQIKPIECIIPALLQRPVYPGHAALDFGTTNSACVYFDPQKGQPAFPDKIFSPLQTRALTRTIDWLMKVLEERSLKDSKYIPLSNRFINCARELWLQSSGGRVLSFDDIRNYFRELNLGEDATIVSEMQAELLVSWGVRGYREFCQQHREAGALLTRLYHDCLDRIIDIDIQEDCQIFLPELEEGMRDGKISSTIRMDELVAREEDLDFPTIDPYSSRIKMGTAIEESMKEPTPLDNVARQANLEKQTDQYTIHKVFITGTKRWIGQPDKAYFIDKKGNVFKDSYQPICTLGIKHLISKIEQSIAHQAKSLNDLVITYPANMPQHRRELLRQIVRGLGVKNVDTTFDEATAGALYYMWRDLFTDVFAGIDGFLARSQVRAEDRESIVTGKNERTNIYFQNILLYDMGGGTTDIALLEIGIEDLEVLKSRSGNEGRYFIIRPKILGLTGRDNYGGDNVTLAVFRILKSRLATIVARYLLRQKEKLAPAARDVVQKFEKSENLFTHWLGETSLDCLKEYENVKEDINVLVPTDFAKRPERQAAFFELWNEAEKIKIKLSTPEEYSPMPSTTLATANGGNLKMVLEDQNVAIPERDLDIEVKAEEMERVIKKDIVETFKRARNLCLGQEPASQKPGLDYYIDRIILAGSSSNLRLIREELPKVLGTPFQLPGHKQEFPAPFKPDNHNVIFNSKEAKLAVARGACLPRYFKRVRVDPRDPEIQKHLIDGSSYLDFNTDNVRNYIPFTIKYMSGSKGHILFQVGERMRTPGRDGTGLIARKRVTASETLFCYRIENINQVKSTEGDYYCQFEVLDAISRQSGLKKEEDLEQLQALMQQYLVYMEFDADRTLSCYLYSNLNGNSDQRYIDQVQRPLNEAKATGALCQKDKKGELLWKKGIRIKCSCNNISGETKEILINRDGATGREPVFDEVSMRYSNDAKTRGGVFRFYSDGNELIWQVDISDYEIKSPDFARLKIKFRLTDVPILEYTVYDPDFEDARDNYPVQPVYNDSRRALPFNPFNGDE